VNCIRLSVPPILIVRPIRSTGLVIPDSGRATTTKGISPINCSDGFDWLAFSPGKDDFFGANDSKLACPLGDCAHDVDPCTPWGKNNIDIFFLYSLYPQRRRIRQIGLDFTHLSCTVMGSAPGSA